MNLVRRLFPFRTCTIDIKDGERALQRPCLLYHIKRCQGPCIQAISKDAYRADVEQVELFLEGRQEIAGQGARPARWLAAAERTDYERAAAMRDKIRAIERTMESQKMAAFARTELDLVGMARQDNQAAIQLFVIRDGKMIGRDVFLLDAVREAPDDEVLTSFLEQYYTQAGSIPREVYVPSATLDGADLETFLAERRGGPVHLRVPQRGEKRELLALATRNAGETLAREQARWLADQGKTLAALEELADGARSCPVRRSGSSATTSATSRAASRSAAWSSSRTASRARASTAGSGSRPSAARTTSPVHQEVLRRRFRAVRAGEEGSEEERRWAMPDLVIIDGGKGQVSAAKEALDELGLHDLPLAGLAKEREELFLPGRDRSRSSCRRRRRRSTSSSACATRPTASRSPTTAACARSGASGPPSTTCRASARSASGSCSRCSARSSGSATRRSSRSRRCRGSDPPWRPGSRRSLEA